MEAVSLSTHAGPDGRVMPKFAKMPDVATRRSRPKADGARSPGGEPAFRRRLEQTVRYANITIIEGTGAGLVTARLAEIVLRDENAIVPVGSFQPGHRVTLSLPSVLGRKGIIRVFEPEMDDDERIAFKRSAQILRQTGSRFRREGMGRSRPRPTTVPAE